MENIDSLEILKKEINDLLGNIERYVCFIQGNQNPEIVIENIKTKIRANSPRTFIISAIGSAALIARRVLEILESENLEDYSSERYSSRNREMLFLNRIITI